MLFPAAGLDPSRASGVLRSAGARRSARPTPATKQRAGYIDGKLSSAEAAAYLEKYAMYAPERAQQRVRFIEQYRSYVINYNLGKDMVRRFIESRGGTAGQSGRSDGPNSRSCCRRRGCRRDCSDRQRLDGTEAARVLLAAAILCVPPDTCSSTRRAARTRRSGPTASATTSTCPRGSFTTTRTPRRGRAGLLRR